METGFSYSRPATSMTFTLCVIVVCVFSCWHRHTCVSQRKANSFHGCCFVSHGTVGNLCHHCYKGEPILFAAVGGELALKHQPDNCTVFILTSVDWQTKRSSTLACQSRNIEACLMKANKKCQLKIALPTKGEKRDLKSTSPFCSTPK